MLCEKYKPALIEAAITGSEPAPAIRAHVGACPSCAAELAQQRSLVAAIDKNLHRQMNASVPAAMLQRFEAHLAQQPQPKRAPRLTQIFVGTFATLAAAALILIFLPHWKISTLPPTAKANVAPVLKPGASQIQPISLLPQPVVAEALPPQTSKHANTHAVQIAKTNTVTATQTEPEVLVPPDERLGLEQLIANLNRRADLPVAIVKPVQEQPEQHIASLKMPDIEITVLVVQPLRESNAE
jgi:anti-sigma factor RsiW